MVSIPDPFVDTYHKIEKIDSAYMSKKAIIVQFTGFLGSKNKGYKRRQYWLKRHLPSYVSFFKSIDGEIYIFRNHIHKEQLTDENLKGFNSLTVINDIKASKSDRQFPYRPTSYVLFNPFLRV